MASYEQAKTLLRQSVSRSTLYTLNIIDNNPSTPAERRLTSFEKDYIRLFASKVTLPSISIDQVSSIGQEHMGIQRNTASGVSFGGNQLDIQVIESSEFIAYDMMRNLFNRAGTNLNPRGSNTSGGQRAQRMRYYNDYVFDIKLTKLELPDGSKVFTKDLISKNFDVDHGYKIVSRYKFEKCHVRAIGAIPFDSNATNAYVEFPVSFSFESYYHNNTKTMDLEYRDE